MGAERRRMPSQQPRPGAVSVEAAGLGELALPVLDRLLATAPVGFAVLDTGLRYLLVNEALAEINGPTAADHLGRTVREMVPDLADMVEPMFRRVLDSGEPIRELECSGQVPATPGVVRSWLESVYPVPGADGAPVALAVVVWEVTGRRRAQQERERLLALFDALLLGAPVGLAFLDRDLRYVRVNEALAAQNGLPVAAHLGRTVAEVLPELAPDVEPLLRRVLDSGTPLVDLEVETGPTPRQPKVRRRWVVSYYPVTAAGEDRPYGVGLVVADVTDRRHQQAERDRLLVAERAAREAAEEQRVLAELAAERLVLLQQATARLAAAASAEEVAVAAAEEAVRLLRGTLGQVGLVSESEQVLELVHTVGARTVLVEYGDRLPLSARDPACDAIRTGASVLLETDADWADYPHLADLRARLGTRVLAVAPVPPGRAGRALGAVAVGFATEAALPVEERELLATLAAQCGQALERARLLDSEREAREAAERAQQRLSFLAGASALIAALPDYPGLFARLARYAVPTIADLCAIDLAEGDRARRVATASRDPALQVLTDSPARPADDRVLGTEPVARVMRTGRPELLEAPQAALATLLGPAGERVARAARSAMVVPLTARGRVLGAVTLVSTRAELRYGPEELGLAEEFASRAALAVDNARLFAQRGYVASKLQESLLPRIPVVPGLDLAARYVAAEELAEVGGDFYDVFPLDRGAQEWAVVIGDVAGRGVEAAGITGLARHTLRALAPELPPAAALTRLNEVMCATAESDRFATAALLRLRLEDDGAGLTLSSGGHCPPLLLRADGSVRELGEPGTLLGAFDTVELSEVRLRLQPGDTLLLYTDGVIEAHGVDGLFGEQRLMELLAGCVGWSADAVADRVVEAVARHRTGAAVDDLAVLALRALPQGAVEGRAVEGRDELPADRAAPAAPAAPTASEFAVPDFSPIGGAPLYSLPAVARVTGLPADTITTWTRRYGLVVGHPSPGGHLLFSRDQLAALHYVSGLISGGRSEADAHDLLARRLERGEPLHVDPGPAAERVLLLAERDPYAAQLAEHLLRTAGYRLTLAAGVPEALAAAAARPDLAVVDLMVSGGQGLELIRALKHHDDLPVLAVSALRVADDALEAGADAFLPKPLHPLTLIAAVHDLLGTSAFLRQAGEEG